MAYPVPENEKKRLEALRRYGLLDTPAEQSFDDIALLASTICNTPIALMTLVDENRQWFKARKGLDTLETPREEAFCAHTIMSKHVMVVEDAQIDVRFADNPSVTASPNIRFYAGAPLTDRDGFCLGSLCVIDREPRRLSDEQEAALEALARQVVLQCEYRRISSDLALALADLKQLSGLLPICAHCKNIRNDEGYWNKVEDYISSKTAANFSHGICPNCTRVYFPEAHESLTNQGIL